MKNIQEYLILKTNTMLCVISMLICINIIFIIFNLTFIITGEKVLINLISLIVNIIIRIKCEKIGHVLDKNFSKEDGE